MNCKAFLIILATLAACTNPRSSSRRDSETVYLPSADRLIASKTPRSRTTPASPAHAPASSTPAGEPSSPGIAEETPTPDRKSASGPVHAFTPPDEPLPLRKKHLIERIETLSSAECDEVCLGLELIPRDQVFDHSINPRKLLLQHTSHASSAAEVEDVERAIFGLRR